MASSGVLITPLVEERQLASDLVYATSSTLDPRNPREKSRVGIAFSIVAGGNSP